MTEATTVWVSTTSHRSRDRLRRLVGNPGPSWFSWPSGGRPSGCYYQVPAEHAEAVGRIPGARVLRQAPKDLMKHWTSRETGGPERGNWPVPS